MAIAFLDLDRTIIADNSAKLWLKDQWQHKNISLPKMLHASYWLTKYHLGFTNLEEIILKGIAMMNGLPSSEIIKETKIFFKSNIKNLYRPGALKAIKNHKKNGDKTSLLTSSSDILSSLVAEDLELDYYLCTTLEVDEHGLYTGRPQGLPCFGPNKISFAQNLCQKLDDDLRQCYFYTDSASDLPLMNLVGKPVAVNPDPHLRTRAKLKKWAIVDWGKPHER